MPPKTQMMPADGVTPAVDSIIAGLSSSARAVSETREQVKLAAVLGAVEAAKTVSAATEKAAMDAEHATQKMASSVHSVTETMAASAKAVTAQSKEQFEALIQAGNVVAKGAEEVSREMTSYVQVSMAGAAAMAKALMSAYTLKDMVEIQSDYVKSSFDSMVSNSSRLSEIGVRVATEAWSPLASRMQQGIEKMVRPSL